MLDKLKTYYALKDGPNRSCFFSWNAPVFLFTNENISGYISQMGDLSGKELLTVAAGGDHVFTGLLAGAKNVDTFDLNYLQKHVIELKSKMIKCLSYTDFMRFFFDKSKFFSYDIIRPIWKTFSPGLKIFLLMYYRRHNNRMFRYASAQHVDYDTSQLSYLSNESDFCALARIMPDKIQFEQTDITQISTRFTKKYDVVLLSNIFEYLYPDASGLSEKMLAFYNNILCPIADNILNTDGGQIGLHYSWRTNPVQWQDFISGFQRYTNHSIDDFNIYRHDFNAVKVPSSCSNLGSSPNATDVVLVMSQNLKQR